MDFNRTSKTIQTHIDFKEYYSGTCPFCGCKNYKILNSWEHEVQDLGTSTKKLLTIITHKRIKCLNSECETVYTPEHHDFPSKYSVSMDVIYHALYLSHKYTYSAEKIALQLKEANLVMVHPKTVQFWINTFSEDFFKTYFKQHSDTALDDFKAITIDGTWFNSGKETIGKKKTVEFSSVTKLAEETYLLTWWT